MAGRVRLGARGTRLGSGRGTRLASATLVATLAAAFAFTTPAGAQESPGGTSPETSTAPTEPEAEAVPATGGAETSTGEGSTDGAEPPSEPAPTEPTAETSEPPASEPQAPADTPAAETTPEAGSDAPSDTAPAPETCAPPAADADAGAAPEPASDCAPSSDPACDADAPAGADVAAPPGCKEAIEPEPAPATAPPPPAAPPPPPAPVAAQPSPSASANIVTIVLDNSEPAPAAAPSAPQQAELANRLFPYRSRVSTLLEAVVLDSAEAEPSAPSTDAAGPDDVLDPDLSNWFESVAPSRRQAAGSCVLRSPDLALSRRCAGAAPQSIMTATAAPVWPAIGVTPMPAGAKRALDFQRHRRTRPEARSNAEQEPVAVAPAASPRDHGRRVSGGSSGGGSSAPASLRVFALSTLPLSLAAPVSFPAEPLPTLLPDGELGVPPPASPG